MRFVLMNVSCLQLLVTPFGTSRVGKQLGVALCFSYHFLAIEQDKR